MKRLTFLLLATMSLGLYAQTYCYQYISMVDKETGVKSKGSNSYVYITFQNGKRSCYFSDENGNTTEQSTYVNSYTQSKYDGENYYVYQGEDNGRYVYLKTVTYSSYVMPNYYCGERGGYYPMSQRKEYLYFSKSFDRLNKWADPKDYIIQGSDSESSMVKAARLGSAIGTGLGSQNNPTTYIYVYQRTEAPKKQSDNPTMMY